MRCFSCFSTKLTICFLLALLVASPAAQQAYGHGAGGDIAIFSTNGQVDIGFAVLDDQDEVQEFFDPNENVFSLVLLPQNPTMFVPWEFGSSEPGFDANETELPMEADITYNLLELRYWDGQSAEVQLGPATGINGGVAPSPEKSDALGGFHSHPLFGVNDPNGTPAAGVYVGKLTISVGASADGTEPALADSDPYYMVTLVTDEVTNIADRLDPNSTTQEIRDAQIAAAEAIGEMARLYADDPVNNPVPIYDGINGNVDFTFFANAISAVRVEAVPEPTSLALAGVLLVGIGGGVRRRR